MYVFCPFVFICPIVSGFGALLHMYVFIPFSIIFFLSSLSMWISMYFPPVIYNTQLSLCEEDQEQKDSVPFMGLKVGTS